MNNLTKYFGNKKKEQIRQYFKNKRCRLERDEIATKSQLIFNNFIAHFLLEKKIMRKIGFYIAINNEVSPNPIMNYVEEIGGQLSLPRLNIQSEPKMIFKEYKIGDQLEKNTSFPKLLEPPITKLNVIADIIFVPLLAFDKHCYRLGMGGGFYDSMIKYFRANHQNTIFIGLGYDFQLYQELPIDIWDQSLDFIVSESEIFCQTTNNKDRQSIKKQNKWLL